MKNLEEIKKNHKPQDTLLVAERTCFSRNYIQKILNGYPNEKVLELLEQAAQIRMEAEAKFKKSIDDKITIKN